MPSTPGRFSVPRAIAALLPAARARASRSRAPAARRRRSARRTCAPRRRSCRRRAAARLPALCAQSARNSPPASRTCVSAGVPSCGISTVPVSELIDWTATTARPGRASAVGQRVADRSRAVRRDRQRPRRPARRGTPRRARPPRPAAARPWPGRAPIASASLAPRGEDHLAVPAERRLDPLARVLQRGARRAALGVRARRIGPQREALAHRLARLGAQRRGRGMVEIDTGHRHGNCEKLLSGTI